MRRAYPQFQAANQQIALIGMGSPDEARAFRAKLELPFTALCDPKQRAYAQYGLTARLDIGREILSGKAFRFFADVARYGVSATRQDVMQMGGVFGVDQVGIVRFVHRAKLATDYPRPTEMLRAFAE